MSSNVLIDNHCFVHDSTKSSHFKEKGKGTKRKGRKGKRVKQERKRERKRKNIILILFWPREKQGPELSSCYK